MKKKTVIPVAVGSFGAISTDVEKYVVAIKIVYCQSQLLLKLSKIKVNQGRVAWWLATCARKPKVPGSSPAASYVQR